MSSIKATQIDGDVSIGRNVAIGGTLIAQGHTHFKGKVRVDGWLIANNVRVAAKGLFPTIGDLQKAYPKPLDGWWALIGTSLPAPIYAAKDGVWTPTGGESGELEIDLAEYEEAIENLQGDIALLSGDIQKNEETINALSTQTKLLETDIIKIKTSAEFCEKDTFNPEKADMDKLYFIYEE